MLEPVPPQTEEEHINRLFTHHHIVARCPSSGATLEMSRRQWTLVCGDHTRHKSRWNKKECRPATREEAIAWANRALANLDNI